MVNASLRLPPNLQSMTLKQQVDVGLGFRRSCSASRTSSVLSLFGIFEAELLLLCRYGRAARTPSADLGADFHVLLLTYRGFLGRAKINKQTSGIDLDLHRAALPIRPVRCGFK